MAITRERLMQGMTYDAFKDAMTRNRERLEAQERGVTLEASVVAALRALPRPLDVLVLAEDWCGDVIDNLPILGRLAAESGKLNLHVFPRDQHLDLMDQYLKDGQFRSIPVFVFLDEGLNELGRFIERPQSVTERRARRRQEIYAERAEFGSPDAPVDQLPEEVRTDLAARLAALREELKPVDVSEVVATLGAIARRAAA